MNTMFTLGVISIIVTVLIISVIAHCLKFEASRTNSSWQNRDEVSRHRDEFLSKHPDLFM